MIEIILGIMSNLKGPFQILFYPFLLITIVSLITAMLYSIEHKTEKRNLAVGISKWFGIISVVIGIGCALPSPQQLWEIRLSLIKFHLASPDNINKGADVIYSIARKLECTYLQTNCQNK